MKRPISAATILVITLICAAAVPSPRAKADLGKRRLTPGMVGGGKVAFSRWIVTNGASNREIFTMNADGSGQTNLTNDPKWEAEPDWSPDGTEIAFSGLPGTNTEIFVMNADGSGQTQLTNNPAADGHPAWSPDGTRIAFFRFGPSDRDIFVMNADGSGQTKLTNSPGDDRHPTWSPDGTKIAFEKVSAGPVDAIYVMNANGSGQTKLTSPAVEPDWSADGTKIAFRRVDEIFVMNADGSGQINLTNDPGFDEDPAWSPDGTKIAFNKDDDIHVMNADGSGQTNLTNSYEVIDNNPDWQALPKTTCTGGLVNVSDWGPASPYPSTCIIPPTAGSIADVSVQLNRVSHTFPDDLDLLLVAPNGNNAIFMSDVGGSGDTVNCTLRIDDETGTALPDWAGLACPGIYKPANYGSGDPFPAPAPSPTGAVNLSAFDGGTPSGTWSLYVVDDQAQDTGRIAGWKLTITIQP